MFGRGCIIAVVILLLQSCLTYYQKNFLFHERFARRQFDDALAILEKNKYLQRPKNRLLYLFDKGVTLQMSGNYEESNQVFEEAYIFIDDFQRNIGREALSLVTSEIVRDYGGEDFERVLVHYYKAVNYIMMDRREEAMVEARRINIKLNEISDKYKGENKYKRDAFANLLMGLLYEASGDENNAFIAYRNAYEIYSEDYSRFFGMKEPEQLRKDLIRMAYENGFTEEREFYEKKFGMKAKDLVRAEKEVVMLWHNGLGPVKEELSVNFIIVKGQGGLVMFENKELGMSFSFYSRSQEEHSSLGDLKVVRVAFPKYSPRKQVYTAAGIESCGEHYPLELLENINEIAKKSLQDRMLREFSKTLLRIALKQAAEEAVRKDNEGLGAMVSVMNAMTEKADTRNWQTLPAEIAYARIPVDFDSSEFRITTFKGSHKFTDNPMEIKTPGAVNFAFFHSLDPESLGIPFR